MRHMAGRLRALSREAHQLLLGARPAVTGGAAIVAAVRTELPRGRVRQLHLEDAFQPGAAAGIQDRRRYLDAPAQVAGSPVGRPDVVLGLPAVGERADAPMLEKAPQNADDANPVREPGHPGA